MKCEHCGQLIPTDEEQMAKAEILKRTNRRRQAWVALVMMVAITIAILFVLPEQRLQALSGYFDLIYISFASVVGFYHGTSAWMGKPK
jgi:predicted nucleic acid-binding Zn ribbon protein